MWRVSWVVAMGLVAATYAWIGAAMGLVYVTTQGCIRVVSPCTWKWITVVAAVVSVTLLGFQCGVQTVICGPLEHNCAVGSLGGALGWTAMSASVLMTPLLATHFVVWE